MSSFIILLYGIIQGLAEFLPVSSSGHLALLPSLVNFRDPGVVFDLLLHLGTAIAIIIYFYRDILDLFKDLFCIIKTRSLKQSWFVVNFIWSTLVSVVGILLLKDLSESIGRTTHLIGINLIVFGLLMWFSDLRKVNALKKMSKKESFSAAIIIGIFQSLAIFPGVSRSGITLTAARALKISRQEASRFSFLLSLPIIFASIIYKLPEISKGEATYVEMSDLFLGIGISFIVGILTIHFFLKFIKRIGLLPFTLYRVILGCILLFWF